MRDRIIEAMKARGIKNMATLSRMAGIPDAVLKNMGQGHSTSRKNLEKLAKVLNVSVAWIITGEGEMDSNVAKEAEQLKLTEPEKNSDPIRNFMRDISRLDDQNMRSLLDYLEYLLGKQARG